MLSFFDAVSAPGVDRTKLHSLKDIIGLTICTVISGCDDWEEIEIYGERKQTFLKQFLSFLHRQPRCRASSFQHHHQAAWDDRKYPAGAWIFLSGGEKRFSPTFAVQNANYKAI